jgi:hypothetical protein
LPIARSLVMFFLSNRRLVSCVLSSDRNLSPSMWKPIDIGTVVARLAVLSSVLLVLQGTPGQVFL